MAEEIMGAVDTGIEQEVTSPESQGELETESPEIAEQDSNAADEQPSDDASSEPQADELGKSKKSRDHAFAEMRRENEELKRKIEEQEKAQRLAEEEKAKAERMAKVEETARNMGLSDAEIQQVLEDAEADEQREAETRELKEKLERAESELNEIRIDKQLAEDLAEIQKYDPDVKSLSDLSNVEDFLTFRGAMSGIDAYFAMKSKEERTKINGAKPTGKANQAAIERDYYTSDELDHLTEEEMMANWEKVQRSMARL